MLYFIANYNQTQIVNKSGPPFSGAVVPVLKALELYDSLADLTTLDLVSFSELLGSGPGGNGGVIFAVGAEGHRPSVAGYYPERQAWTRISSAVWIGTDVDPVSGCEQVPRPEELDRVKCPVDSFENVQFADGSIWEVPVIRQPVADGELLLSEFQRSTLPQVFFRDVNSEWRMNVVPKYASLWQRSQKFFENLVDGQPMLYSEMFLYAVDVLSLRYRFNLLVHSRWPEKFITTENVSDIIRASVGWHLVTRLVDENQKKRTAVTEI